MILIPASLSLLSDTPLLFKPPKKKAATNFQIPLPSLSPKPLSFLCRFLSRESQPPYTAKRWRTNQCLPHGLYLKSFWRSKLEKTWIVYARVRRWRRAHGALWNQHDPRWWQSQRVFIKMEVYLLWTHVDAATMNPHYCSALYQVKHSAANVAHGSIILNNLPI